MRGREGLLNYITHVPHYNPLKQALPDIRGDKANLPQGPSQSELCTKQDYGSFLFSNHVQVGWTLVGNKGVQSDFRFLSRCSDCSCFFLLFRSKHNLTKESSVTGIHLY